MSAPGYWELADRSTIRITEMADSHLLNSLRLLRRRLTSTTSPLSSTGRDYTIRKIIELGEDAQRRQLIPTGDIPLQQLYDIIDSWTVAFRGTNPQPAAATAAVRVNPIIGGPASPVRSPPHATYVPVAANTKLVWKTNLSEIKPFRAIPRLKMPISDIEEELAMVTGFAIFTVGPATTTTPDRRLDLDEL